MENEKSFEENFNILKKIAEELNSSDLKLDELLIKGQKAQETAKKCLKVLKEHKGKFVKLENDLLKISEEIDNFSEDEEQNE